jgi:hypothetical protein
VVLVVPASAAAAALEAVDILQMLFFGLEPTPLPLVTVG